MRQRLIAAVVAAASSCSAAVQELRNGFDDPFFQLGSAIVACPEPAGPRITEAERLAQSHHRVARGVIRRLPHVQQVVVIVSSRPGERPPYGLFAAPDKPAGTPRFSAPG